MEILELKNTIPPPLKNLTEWLNGRMQMTEEGISE